MKDHHFSKDSRIFEKKDGNYMAMDYCSYGKVIDITRKEIE